MHITLEEIKERGEKIREFMKGKFPEVGFGNNKSTVEWIDGYIHRNRDIFSEEMRYGWAVAFGYLIGEAMNAEYNSEWNYLEKSDMWGIQIPNIGWASPIGKIDKYLVDDSDSILSFYEVVGKAIEKGGMDKVGS